MTHVSRGVSRARVPFHFRITRLSFLSFHRSVTIFRYVIAITFSASRAFTKDRRIALDTRHRINEQMESQGNKYARASKISLEMIKPEAENSVLRVRFSSILWTRFRARRGCPRYHMVIPCVLVTNSVHAPLCKVGSVDRNQPAIVKATLYRQRNR